MNIFLAPWRWANDVAIRMIVWKTVNQWELEDMTAAKAEEGAWEKATPSPCPTYPHCDSNVLHAPSECVYCDRCPTCGVETWR